jgi:Ni/Fe-hydrogenase subunit HybB-like protein
MAGIAGLGLVLCLWREVAGLAAATAMNDGYSWGMFKNFNVTTLTALGSGGYALGVLTYVLNRRKYHTLMRTALLTSILAYTVGMIALATDIGRPWNILHMADPFVWNPHSILFEVALCMSAYVMIALDFENLAPLLERLEEEPFPQVVRELACYAKRFVKAIYPYGVALALALPTMHQSSLGSLMLVAGPRVHPLWQTPLLPLLYVMMAWVLGIAFVEAAVMASCAVWKRPLDMTIVESLTSLVSWSAIFWLAVRLGDLYGRGQIAAALKMDFYSRLFLVELALIAIPTLLLRIRSVRMDAARSFVALAVLMTGGMLYRYTPTTLAFQPGAGYRYFPSVTELLISLGFIALAVVGYLFTVKRFAILPATLEMSIRGAVPGQKEKQAA